MPKRKKLVAMLSKLRDVFSPYKTAAKEKESDQRSLFDMEYTPVHLHPLTGERSFIPFSNQSKILLIGEGNFSFAVSLAQHLRKGVNIVATCLDSKAVLLEKYPDAEQNLRELYALGATVLFSIDCATLDKCKELQGRKFTRIVFNFPHVGMGIKDRKRNIKANQDLLCKFFVQASKMLQDHQDDTKCYRTTMIPCGIAGGEGIVYGWSDDSMIECSEIMVTLKTGDPYDDWEIKKIANAAKLKCRESFEFIPSLYPKYGHRRSLGFSETKSRPNNEEITKRKCKTYVFKRK